MRLRLIVVGVGLVALLGACAASPRRQQSDDLTQLIQLRAEATTAITSGRMRRQEGERIATELDWAQNDIEFGAYSKAEAFMTATKIYLDALK